MNVKMIMVDVKELVSTHYNLMSVIVVMATCLLVMVSVVKARITIVYELEL